MCSHIIDIDLSFIELTCKHTLSHAPALRNGKSDYSYRTCLKCGKQLLVNICS